MARKARFTAKAWRIIKTTIQAVPEATKDAVLSKLQPINLEEDAREVSYSD